MMMSVFLLISAALGQECPPEPTDACALQALPSDDFYAVEWVDNAGSWHANAWWSTVQVSDDHPSVYRFDPTMAASTTNTHEQACAIDDVGAIRCYGNSNANSQISGRPTGAEPYASLAVGNVASSSATGQAWGAINSSGQVVTWGNVTANSFNTNRPSGSGYDAVAVGFGPVGCAADQSGTGVSCWGSDTQSIVSGAPSTGTYKALGIGRYVAGGVTTAGALTLWGSSTSSGFRSTWPGGTDVLEVFFNEVSDQVGVAYHTDHTITVWQNPSVGQLRAIKNVPCLTGTNCPGTADKFHRTATTFRTAPRMVKADAPISICGVVESDPNGQYGCGDVICWGHYAENTGDPVVISECADPTYCD